MRQATKNPDVLRKNDAQIREAERGLSYFENTLRDLQARKLQMSQGGDHLRSGSVGTSGPGLPPTPRSVRQSDRDRSLPPAPDHDHGGSPMRSPGPGAGFGDIQGAPKAKQYNNLDLIKADTPHTTAKISRMLHQLEFKLQVEMQYKKGIDKMAKLYQADGDKKSRADAESKRVESEKKIQLLQSALKRYKNLHILDDAEEEEEHGEVQRYN
jgi:Hr1 repeat